MDYDKAKELLRAERLRTERLLSELSDSGGADRIAANQSGDMYDSAEPLTAQEPMIRSKQNCWTAWRPSTVRKAVSNRARTAFPSVAANRFLTIAWKRIPPRT